MTMTLVTITMILVPGLVQDFQLILPHVHWNHFCSASGRGSTTSVNAFHRSSTNHQPFDAEASWKIPVLFQKKVSIETLSKAWLTQGLCAFANITLQTTSSCDKTIPTRCQTVKILFSSCCQAVNRHKDISGLLRSTYNIYQYNAFESTSSSAKVTSIKSPKHYLFSPRNNWTQVQWI